MRDYKIQEIEDTTLTKVESTDFVCIHNKLEYRYQKATIADVLKLVSIDLLLDEIKRRVNKRINYHD